MSISAKFQADFTSWRAEVDRAETQLRAFQSGAASVEKQLSRVGSAFSGQSILKEATLAAKAVGDLGGVSRLTDSEQARLNATLNEAIAKYRALGQTAPKSMTDLADATKQSSGWIKTLGQDILTTAAGFVTAQAVIAGIKTGVRAFADEVVFLTMHGSAVSDVTANFEHLAAQSGRLGSTLVGELRAGTHGTIADFELMQLAAGDLAADLNLTDQQFGTLAKGAFALAQATGTDVKTALDTMNSAMLTGQERALKRIVSTADIIKGEEAFAHHLGTTIDQLNDEGKLEAKRAGILFAVGEATDKLGDQIDGLDERVQQAQASWANFHNELSRVVAESPVLAAAFDNISAELGRAFGVNQEKLIHNIADAIDAVAISIVGAARQGVEAGGFLAKEWIALNKVFGNLAQVIDGVRVSYLLLAEGMAKVRGDTDAFTRFDQQLASLEVKMVERGKSLKAMDQAQADVDTTTTKLLATFDGLTAKMIAAQAANHGFGAEMNALIESTSGAAAANRGLGATTGPTASGLTKQGAAAHEAATKVKDFGDAMDRLIKQAEASGFAFAETAQETKDFGSAMESLVESTSKETFEFAKATAQVADFGSAMEAAIQQAESSGFAIADAGTKAGKGWYDGIRSATSRIPDLLIQAFTGGGGAIGAAKAFGVQLGSAIADGIMSRLKGKKKGGGGSDDEGGSFLGGIFSDLVSGGISALVGVGVGKLVDLIGGIGGPSKAEQSGRALTDQFTASLGSALDYMAQIEVHQLVAAGNSEKWATQIVALNAAYLKAGLTVDEVAADVNRLHAAEKQGGTATQRVIDDIIAKTHNFADATVEATDKLHTMGDEGVAVAQTITAAFSNMRDVISQPIEIQVRYAVENFPNLSGPGGGKATASDIEAFLRANPGDVGRLPTAFGNITDPNLPGYGHAYDSQGNQVSYGALGGFVTDKGVQYFGVGGRVWPWKARGTDTVPAMLTPGEGVLSRRGMAALSRLNSGGGGVTFESGAIQVNINGTVDANIGATIGNAIVEEMRRKGVRFRAA